MNPRIYLGIAVLVLIIVLYALGSMLSEQCVSIDGCKGCWYTVKKEITSELCPTANKKCIAEPYKMQHNALVDVLLCACAKAKKVNYEDEELNRKIIDVYKQMNCPRNVLNCEISASVTDVCEKGLLTKWKY